MLNHKIKDFFFGFKNKEWPSKKQWKRFFKAPHLFFEEREKVFFFGFLILFLGSAFFLAANFYLKNTEIKPARGGIHIEGVIGQPRFINPIYSHVSDIDRDLTELVFSGLFKYDSQGEIIPDLVESYEIKEEGKVYQVKLKEDLFWSDGHPLTADDVVFTVKTIQDSDYKSPIRASWLGVEVEKISDLSVSFRLGNPYNSFLESLTLKPIPRHIWQDIPSQNFALTVYNLKPVGSGPYELKNLRQDQQGKIVSLDLVKNGKYHGNEPYLLQVSFYFFDTEAELVESYRKGDIKGFSLSSADYLKNRSVNLYSFFMPRYFAVFFNPDEAEMLSDPNIRQALNYGINKDKIIEDILAGQGKVVHSPVLPDIYNLSDPSEIYEFDPEKAKDLLKNAGFVESEEGFMEKIITEQATFEFKSDLKQGNRGKEVEELQRCLAKDSEVYPDGTVSGYFGEKTKEAVIRFQEKYAEEILEPWGFDTGTGMVSETTRKKLNEICFFTPKETLPLSFSLTTVNQPVLMKVARFLEEQWSALGIRVQINMIEAPYLEKDVIKPRSYQSLLLGQVLGIIPDPFPFWHSVQRKDPGLNLTGYENREADRLLEVIRQTQDEIEKRESLERLQELLVKNVPAIFLYNPSYLYFASKEIKGIQEGIIPDPSKRFTDIENWYIKTKRVWR